MWALLGGQGPEGPFGQRRVAGFLAARRQDMLGGLRVGCETARGHVGVRSDAWSLRDYNQTTKCAGVGSVCI